MLNYKWKTKSFNIYNLKFEIEFVIPARLHLLYFKVSNNRYAGESGGYPLGHPKASNLDYILFFEWLLIFDLEANS